MKYLLIVLLLSGMGLHAAVYDSTLLKAHARLLPKIALLDKGVEKKLVNGKLKLLVVTASKDMASAIAFKNMIDESYRGKVMQFPLEVEIIDANMMDLSAQASGLYLLALPADQMQKALRLAKKEGIVSFTYNLDDLSRGALVSVRVEAKTVIYFNRSNWDAEALALRPEFFKVARPYE